MLFDKACNIILEGQFVEDNFELITPEDFSHIIIRDYFYDRYELYEIENVKSSHSGQNTTVPDITLIDNYEGPIPPKGYVKADVTTGRDIMDLHNLTRYDGFIPQSYYIVKYSDRVLKKIKDRFDWFEAYLKPAEKFNDYTSKDTGETFQDLMGQL